MNDRILLLDGHPGLFLLKNAFSLPRLLLTLRSAPCHPELLAEYDVITRLTTEALCNIHLDDNSWSQAKLPFRYGGLGLCTAEDLALPAFLSSRTESISLVNEILRQPTNKQEDDDEVRAWLDQNLVLPSNAHKQRNWDDIQCSSAVTTLVPVLNQHRLACFKAASRPESGVWLNCVPNNRVGTFIDNDTLSIGVALRVGLTVCTKSSVIQRTNKRTTMRFGLGLTEISSYLPTLISKEIGTIYSALQPSPPWFPYSTSIVWHVSRRLRVLSRASGLTASQTTVGTFIDNDILRIGVALCVGLTVCIPHRCKCGTTMDTFGTHPLSCRFRAGHIPRHSALNDVVRRGLSAAGIPSMLEPSGLDRGDGKRPNRTTVYPYSRGR